MDEWENGLSDEYEQEETSELQRELTMEREAALDLEIERSMAELFPMPDSPIIVKLSAPPIIPRDSVTWPTIAL